MTKEELKRFSEIYDAASGGAIDCVDEPLKSDFWFVCCMLHDAVQQHQYEAIDKLFDMTPEELGQAAVNALACPGCGCTPGDGITESCNDPMGCGYAKSVKDP